MASLIAAVRQGRRICGTPVTLGQATPDPLCPTASTCATATAAGSLNPRTVLNQARRGENCLMLPAAHPLSVGPRCSRIHRPQAA
jgi:hypothetical protein